MHNVADHSLARRGRCRSEAPALSSDGHHSIDLRDVGVKVLARLHDDAAAREPVTDHLELFLNADVLDVLERLVGRHFVQGVEPGIVNCLLTLRALAVVHSHVAQPEAHNVLEEVGALGRGYCLVRRQGGLDNHLRRIDLAPAHGDSPRLVRRAPPAGPDEEILLARPAQGAVDLADLSGDLLRRLRREGVWGNVHDVGDAREAAVAEGCARGDSGLLRGGKVGEAEGLGGLGVRDELRHGPDLEDGELVVLVRLLAQVDSELELNGTGECGAAQLQEEGERLVERQGVAAHGLLNAQLRQRRGRRVGLGRRVRAAREDNLLAVRVARLELDERVHGRGTGHGLEQAHLVRLLHGVLCERGVSEDGAHGTHACLGGQMQDHEIGRLARGDCWVSEAPVHGRVAVHDRGAEADGHGRAAVVGGGVGPRVEVDGVGHAREGRPKDAGGVLAAGDLLNDDGHLLVGDLQATRLRVAAGLEGEDGRVHALHRRCERGDALLLGGHLVVQHVALVDSGKRLLEGVLEEARGSHGHGRGDALGVLLECVHGVGRQRGHLEELFDLRVRGGARDGREQVVALDEAVEDVGGEDEALRDAEFHSG
mmetsp:Transcript_6645/g.17997  ORF Transcript_6645/g.17997 Transcript_6645/m.17997 type:complete len:597 (-) Transcript_6645:1689-3479(-)